MGEATILTMVGILSPSDAPSVSTIVEEMFQFFDESVRCANYKTIDRSVRLRLALRVLGDAGYARLDIMRPKPTVVPTEKLLQLLEVKKLTTDEEPLSLLPAGACVSQQDAARQLQYARAFKSAVAKEMANFLHISAAMLPMGEIGMLRHSRAPGGDLRWFANEADAAVSYQQAVAANDIIGADSTTMEGVEVEFEMNDRNILLVRYDDLPLADEPLDVLAISHKELLALFETAAKLLAGSNPEDPMRAYAARDSSGQWQVKLLPP